VRLHPPAHVGGQSVDSWKCSSPCVAIWSSLIALWQRMWAYIWDRPKIYTRQSRPMLAGIPLTSWNICLITVTRHIWWLYVKGCVHTRQSKDCTSFGASPQTPCVNNLFCAFCQYSLCSYYYYRVLRAICCQPVEGSLICFSGRPPSNLVYGQELTMCDIVWISSVT